MRFANTKIVQSAGPTGSQDCITEYQNNGGMPPLAGGSNVRKSHAKTRQFVMNNSGGTTLTKGNEARVAEKLTIHKQASPLSPNVNHRIRSLKRAGSPG